MAPNRSLRVDRILDVDVPRLLGALSASKMILSPASGKCKRSSRRRGAGPVPIPFYGQPSAHKHSHVEVALVVRGQAYCEVRGAARVLRRGSVLVLPPNCPHYDTYVTRNTPYTMLWYILWPGHPRVNISRYTPRGGFELVWVAEMRDDSVAQDDWELIASLMKDARPPAERLRELLFALYAGTLEARRRGGPMAKTDAVRKVVRDAAEFLEEHLDQAPTVEMAASFVGLSPTYLTTLARKELGQSLHELLHDVRLRKARELLANSTLSVKQVAHLSGFSAADYFSRAFHKATGMTPRQFREDLSKS
jgi:AraC-like DNA-binding protein/mannose-6-phosphate isomerase-like protein (cupin superfamily)